MDWNNRPARPAQPGQVTSPSAPAPAHHNGGVPKKSKGPGILPGRLVTVVLLFALTLLIIAVISFLMLGKERSSESSHIDKSKMQAVFLNGGQVYFGKIKDLNGKYVQLDDIYYLRVNQQVQPNQSNNQAQQDISLVKLGCELHGPANEMFINREQVVFWENLRTDGKVAQAVDAYVKANPEGQKCPAADSTSTTPTPAPTPSTTPSPTPSTNR